MIRPTVVRPAMHDDNILVDSIFLPLNLEQESCRNNLQDRCLKTVVLACTVSIRPVYAFH